MPIDGKWLVNLSGKEFVLWGGLLDLAHQQGLQSLKTTLVQAPASENGNLAIFKAEAIFADGRIFVAHGDASATNVGGRIGPHYVRMAETRAKGRCLRDALNIGATMFEELGDDDAAHAVPAGPAPRHPAATRAVQNAERETAAARVSRPAAWIAPDGKPYSRMDLAEALIRRQARAKELGVPWHTFDVDAADESQIYEETAALIAAIRAHEAAAAA